MIRFKNVTISRPDYGVLKNPLIKVYNCTAKLTHVIEAVYFLYNLTHVYILVVSEEDEKLYNCWYAPLDEKVIYRQTDIRKLQYGVEYVL